MALSNLHSDVDNDASDTVANLHESLLCYETRLRQRLENVQTKISGSVTKKTDLYQDRLNAEHEIKTLEKQDEILRDNALHLRVDKAMLEEKCRNREQILTDIMIKEATYSTFTSTPAKVGYVLFGPIINLPVLFWGLSKSHEAAKSNFENAREHWSSAARKLDDNERALRGTECRIMRGRDRKVRCEDRVKALRGQIDNVYTNLKSLTKQETSIKRQITFCGESSTKYQYMLEHHNAPLSLVSEKICSLYEHTDEFDNDDDSDNDDGVPNMVQKLR